ncbi:hypothetical protein D8S78_11230 [Natrialba swarupiae]|nr:hypothetical protein [Natrialba swarupiae]
MSDERNSISRRNVLPGLGTAGIGAAPVGAGTNAMFSDDVEFEDDQLVTGELDLKLDWQQHYLGPTDEWEFVNAHPDDEGDGEQSIGESEFSTTISKSTDRSTPIRRTDRGTSTTTSSSTAGSTTTTTSAIRTR